MANSGYEVITGLREQILGNCDFISSETAYNHLILSREPAGLYKASVVRSQYGRRGALLSSKSAETVVEALEQLLTRSAEAVQLYVSAHGYGRLTVDKDDDDDALSTVTSYLDEPDKPRLADSRITLESEPESAYESLSEDDGDGGDDVRYGGARRARPRSYGDRTVRCASPPSPRRAATDEPPSHGRPGAGRQGRYLVQHIPPPVHRRRSSPPRVPNPNSYTPRIAYDPPNGRVVEPYYDPSIGSRPPPMPLPHPMWSVNSGPTRRPHDPPGYQQRPPMLAHESRTADGSSASMPTTNLPPLDMLLPLRSQPPQPFPPRGSLPPMPMSMPPPMPPSPEWVLSRYQDRAKQPPPPHPKPLVSAPHQVVVDARVETETPAPDAPREPAASSASSTPTLTAGGAHTPPESPLPAPAKKIDYRMAIKTFRAKRDPEEPSSSRDQPPQEMTHRMIAHGAPTRQDMRTEALRYLANNRDLFREAALDVRFPLAISNEHVRVDVTRAWLAGDSYDLAAYGADDFSALCRGMGAALPLFEVVVSHAWGRGR